MHTAGLRFLVLVAAVFLIGSIAPVQAQGAFSHGTVVALQGTPHLWFADERGVLHWGGDTRALAGKHIAWSNRVEVSLRPTPHAAGWRSLAIRRPAERRRSHLSGQVGDRLGVAAAAPHPVHRRRGAIRDQRQQLRQLRDRPPGMGGPLWHLGGRSATRRFGLGCTCYHTSATEYTVRGWRVACRHRHCAGHVSHDWDR